MPAKRDILIRVYGRHDPSASYPVDAELDDGSYFFSGELRIQDNELFRLGADIPAYGAKLGQYLFSAPIQRALEKAYATVGASAESVLRVRLCFYPDAWELHAYPWERMLASWQGQHIPIAASSLIPFSRYIQLPDSQQAPIEERPIRILFAVANPAQLPQHLQAIQVEEELRGLLIAVSGLDDLAITVLAGRTPVSDEFKALLAKAQCTLISGPTTLNRVADLAGRNDIVHILSHGLYDSGTATLCLESDTGDFAPVVDTAIQAAIAGLARKPRLIYLSACNSATEDPDDLVPGKPREPHPMVGLAPKLVESGIPAVLAMQDVVEVGLAHDLAGVFYNRLLELGEVDRALSEARFTVYQRNSKYWAVPALFLRLKEGRLFATDPVREALNATLAAFPEQEQRHYLPLEATSLRTPELISDWERTSQQDQTSEDLWKRIQPFRPNLTIVIGDAGSGKSTTLGRLTRATALLAPVDGIRIVPLLVDLNGYCNVRSHNDSRIKRLIVDAFQSLVPGLDEGRFTKLVTSNSFRLRVLFDHADQLPDRARRQALREITDLYGAFPRHQFMVALDCRSFRPWPEIQELLVIQPLSMRKVDSFLAPNDGLSVDPDRKKLRDAICNADLYELAAVPWLLLHMLEQVKHNILPQSRHSVLLDWIETALYQDSEDGGRSVRAPESLCALAWAMQSGRLNFFPLERAFSVLDKVRGQRDYNLEELLDRLVASRILLRAGDESIRFAYPPLQAFGAARHLLNDPDRECSLEEIVATLGSPARVRWWMPTLALFSGMLDDPVPLLRRLVYAASLMQGEQVFVAAKCLREFERERLLRPGPAAPNPEIEGLRQQICAALQWRARRSNESNVEYRCKAVELLGIFRRQETIPLLIALAVERVKIVDARPPDYEYSQVRFAAIRSLRLMQNDIDPALIQKYPDAVKLIGAWEKASVETLSALLHGPDVGIQGVAAFALGDLQKPEGAAELYSAFREPTTNPATLWAITDALQALDPSVVIQDLVLPMVREAARAPRPPTEDRYERLIYLIGQLRLRDPDAIAFINWYLSVPCGKQLKGRALTSLGKLRAWSEAFSQQWSEVARGNLEPIAAAAEADKIFLQRKAIEALGQLGDLQLLYNTRQGQAWVPELDEAFFRAAESAMAYCGERDSSKGDSNGASRPAAVR